MKRPSKSEIERLLLSGAAVSWLSPAGKAESLRLSSVAERRLFAFLLKNSDERAEGPLPQAYIDGLAMALLAGQDPAQSIATASAMSVSATSWRIQSIETQNFGGLNLWGKNPFRLNFGTESIVIEGDNGCGKTSLAAAFVWALKGLRPRDQRIDAGDLRQPVVDVHGVKIGDWPPLVVYPTSRADLSIEPSAKVSVILKDDLGNLSEIVRTLGVHGVSVFGTALDQVPEVFLTTGFVMPSRLAQIRFGENQSSLTDSVKQLTGLDELANLAGVCDRLAHKSGRYRNYSKQAKLEEIKQNFQASLTEAGIELKQIGKEMPAFLPSDAVGKEGSLVTFGMSLAETSKKLAGALAADVMTESDIAGTRAQAELMGAIGVAKTALKGGLESLPTWGALSELSITATEELKTTLVAAITIAEAALTQARQTAELLKIDTKLQLKAVAADWHRKHAEGEIDNCPLCEQSLQGHPALKIELNKLRLKNAVAVRSFEDTVLSISAGLSKLVPESMSLSQFKTGSIREKLIGEINRRVGQNNVNLKSLQGFQNLLKESIAIAPTDDLPTDSVAPQYDRADQRLRTTIDLINRAFAVSGWMTKNRSAWEEWWDAIVNTPSAGNITTSPMGHLDDLANAIQVARPYSAAVEHLRQAVTFGREILKIEEEQSKRDAVGGALLPLKNLKALTDWVARTAIEELSGRIEAILNSIHLTESLKFSNADFNRKEGVLVRAGFTKEVQLDATLIANASWLRSVLWAFIFALREEAVEQWGMDPLPVMFFDDPQATFDFAHRLNWACYVGDIQRGPSKMQIVLTTHDKAFLQNLIAGKVEARRARMLPALPQSGPAHVLDGDVIQRAWRECEADVNDAELAVSFLGKARIHIEAMLRCMLAGEGHDVSMESVKALLFRVGTRGSGNEQPWCRPVFVKLIAIFAKPEFQWLQEAHHATCSLTFVEAKAFWSQWLGAKKVLESCFDDVLERRIVYGTSNILHFPIPTIEFPEGRSETVRKYSFSVIGQAAALTDGRVSEGKVNFLEKISGAKITLGNHSMFRLVKPTLEPVARRGDFLIVRQFGDEPVLNSIVVAAWQNSLVARRYAVSPAHSDLGILTAQALDPTSITAPLVATAKGIKMRVVVGVIYGSKKFPNAVTGDHEFRECDGDAQVQMLLSRCIGLVTVKGWSAQPLALDGQHLMVGAMLTHGTHSLEILDGSPVVASDSDGHYYFKRLRLVSKAEVILESLDGGGDFPPELLSLPGTDGPRELRDVWPVLGVLFELPGV